MNARLYTILLFLLGLSAGAALLQALIHFQVSSQLFFLDSYGRWLFSLTLTNLIAAIITLKYYQMQQYRFALFAGTIFTVFTTGYAVTLFMRLQYHQLSGYTVPLQLLTSASGLVYSASLILLAQKRKYWL